MLMNTKEVSPVLSDEDVFAISQIASDVLMLHRDHDLVQKVTIMMGYSQLAAQSPQNPAYHHATLKAAADLVEVMRRRKLGNAELVARLERVLESTVSHRPEFRNGQPRN